MSRDSPAELLAWLNDLLHLNYTKIEQCGTGGAYLQVLDRIFGDVPIMRAKMSAKQEHEYVANYKIMLAVFKNHEINKPISVDKLIQGHIQDNLEFLRWLNVFWEINHCNARRKGITAAVAPIPTRAAEDTGSQERASRLTSGTRLDSTVQVLTAQASELSLLPASVEIETGLDLEKLPYARFGFTPHPAPARGYTNTLNCMLSLKCLGDDRWPSLDEAQYQNLPALLAYLASARSIASIPRELLDLRQPEAKIASESNWPIAVNAERFNGELFYVLRPRGSRPADCALHILLPSAATTLQAIRLGWGPDLIDIISHLLAHGIAFRLCIRDRVGTNPHPPLPERYTGLGFHRMGFKPTLADHESYVALRERFLASSRGRAARFAGGIVGRLARPECSDEDLASLRPSADVFLTGVRLWDGKSSTAYWDDSLTDQEVDFICGVYEIATGRVTNNDGEWQTTKVSWWPTHRAFAKSGLNVGWWSPDCERWFQQRLAAIKSDTAKLHTQAEWKHVLKYYQKSRDVAAANERIAAEFLDSRLGFPPL